MHYRKEIDGIRALAVLSVIFFHAGVPFLTGGFLGVDVFFVISGYLITSILLAHLKSNTFSFKTFYIRRARRILPALMVMVLCSSGFAWLWMTPDQLQEFSQSVLSLFVFSSNLFFWLKSGYFDSAAEEKPLLHTWSLAVEEQFYLLFPIFLFWLWKQRREQIEKWLWVGTLMSLGLAQWLAFRSPSANFYLPLSRAWELLAGALLALRPLPFTETQKSWASYLGLTLIFLSVFKFSSLTPNPSLYTLFPVLGTVLLISGSHSGNRVGRFLAHPFLSGIGLMSYSLYLWHQPVFAFFRIQSPIGLTSSDLFVALGLLFLLSIGSWILIEKPFRNSLQVSARFFANATALCSGFLLILGSWGFLGKGIPSRLPASVQNLISPPAGKGTQCDLEDSIQIQGEEVVKCRVGTKNQKATIAFIGDSHTGSLNAALSELLEAHGLSAIMINSALCAPLMNFGSDEPRTNKQCRKIMTSALQQIAKASEIKTVVLFARWAIYTEGKAPKDKEAIAYQLDDKPNQDPLLNSELFLEAFEKTKTLLLNHHKKVILIKSVPEHDISIPHFLIRSAIAKKPAELPKEKQITFEKYLKRNAHLENIFSQATDWAEVIETPNIFCKQSYCEFKNVEGLGLYVDDNHLAYLGAKLLLEDVLPRL